MCLPPVLHQDVPLSLISHSSMNIFFNNFKNNLQTLLLIIILLVCDSAIAGAPVFEIQIKDHLFLPSTIEIPSDTKVKLLVKNLDPTAEEFESYELNREKVIAGNSKAVIFLGPLAPGEYPFFGEFFPKTAQGKIIVKD